VVSPDGVLGICAEIFGLETADLAREGAHTPARILAASMLMKYASCTQRQAAGLLGWRSGAALCMQRRRMEAALAIDDQFDSCRVEAERRCQTLADGRSQDANAGRS